jgi:CubicO group peptidase (beta-lactamase class C family)
LCQRGIVGVLATIVFVMSGCQSVTTGNVPTVPASTTTSATATTTAPTNAQAMQHIEAYLDQLNADGNVTASILVARGTSVLLSKGYGLASEEQHIPNTPQTRFRIGSITKQFTAMAILILQQQGKLHVHDLLCKYIMECPSAWAPITLQELLTHSSGIPDYTNFSNFPEVIGTPVSVADLIQRFKALPLDFTPGSRWSYSNSNYVLLGYIIEELSGQTYADFLTQHIFQPLQMNNTGYDSNTLMLPTHADGYLSPGVHPVYLDMSEFYAAGALYSTVGDLFIWDQALLAHRLVPAAALADMFAVHIPCPAGGCALSTDLGYGYGWFIAEQAGHRYDYHWGRIDGFRSSNGFYPQDGVIVIVLSNLETTDTWDISVQLGNLALGLPDQ